MKGSNPNPPIGDRPKPSKNPPKVQVGFSALDDADRQLVIRGLALQSLRDPGFEFACRQIAIKLAGVTMFDQLFRSLSDITPPAEHHVG